MAEGNEMVLSNRGEEAKISKKTYNNGPIHHHPNTCKQLSLGHYGMASSGT